MEKLYDDLGATIVSKIKQLTTLEEAFKSEFFTVQEIKGINSIYKNNKTLLDTTIGLYSIELYKNKEFQKAYFRRCLTLTYSGSKNIRFVHITPPLIHHSYIRSHLTHEEQLYLYSGIDSYKEALRSFISSRASDYNEKQFDLSFPNHIQGNFIDPNQIEPLIYWKPSEIFISHHNGGAYYLEPFTVPFSLLELVVDAFSVYDPLYFIHFWRLTKKDPSYFVNFLKSSNHLEKFKSFVENLSEYDVNKYLSNSSSEFLQALGDLKINIPTLNLIKLFGTSNDKGFFWNMDYHYDKQENRDRTNLFFKLGNFFGSKYTKKEIVLASLKKDYIFSLDSMLKTNFISKSTLLKVYQDSNFDFSTQVRAYVLNHSDGVNLSTPTELAFNKQTKLLNEKTLLQAMASQDIDTISLQLPLLDKNLIQQLSPKLYLFAFEGNHSTVLKFLSDKKIPLHRSKKTIESVIEYIATLGSVTSFKKAFAITSALDDYTLSRLIEIAVERDEINIAKIVFNKYSSIPFTARALGMALYGGLLSFVELIIQHKGNIITRSTLTDNESNTYKLIERSKGFHGPGNEYRAEFSSLAISSRFRYLGKYNPVEKMKKGTEKARLACIKLLIKHKLYDLFSLGLMTTLAFHEEDLAIVDALLPLSPYVIEKVRTVTKRSIGFNSLSKSSRSRLDTYVAEDPEKLVSESYLKDILEYGE